MGFKYIFFDLDGTLIDSKEGIVRCIQYAISRLGIDEIPYDKLVSLIGPPIQDTFQILLDNNNQNLVDKAVELYRERFSTKGVVEAQIYEGVVIAINNRGISKTFTVRRVSYDVGVERVFPIFSPRIAKIEVVRKAKIRRAKLYYLRERRGKSAKLWEKRAKISSVLETSPEELAAEAVEEESAAVEENTEAINTEETSTEE